MIEEFRVIAHRSIGHNPVVPTWEIARCFHSKAFQILAPQLGQPAPLQQISQVEAPFLSGRSVSFFCGRHHFLESSIWHALWFWNFWCPGRKGLMLASALQSKLHTTCWLQHWMHTSCTSKLCHLLWVDKVQHFLDVRHSYHFRRANHC